MYTPAHNCIALCILKVSLNMIKAASGGIPPEASPHAGGHCTASELSRSGEVHGACKPRKLRKLSIAACWRHCGLHEDGLIPF